jgi:hypothetical protein
MSAPHPARDFAWGYLHPITGERVGPQPRQYAAHVSLADITFYGGAAGGGKSEMIMVEAVSYCLMHPGVEVAVFRRKHTELEKSLVGRFRKLVPRHIAKYSKTDKVARFYNGSLLWFCHCKDEGNVYDYQSAEWALLCIDEASHFTEFQVKYLLTRVRTTLKGVRTRVILGSNPGNVGHGWLKRWFIAPDPRELGDRHVPAPGAVWRPHPTKDGEDPAKVRTRCYIPARLEDNRILMEADPNYEGGILQLGGDKAKQLRWGDWDANDSMIVGPEWRQWHTVTERDPLLRAYDGVRVGSTIPWHVIPDPSWRPGPDDVVFGSVDYGYGAPWSFHLHAALPNGHTRTWWERYESRVKDIDQAKWIAADLRELKVTPQWIVLDPSMYNSRAEMGLAKSIAEVYFDHLRDLTALKKGAAGRPARLSRPNRWLDALSTAPDGLPWHTLTTACPHAIRTVPEVPWDEDDPEVEDDESENHAYEDIGRFFEARPHHRALPPADPLAHLDPLSAAHHRAREQQAAGTRQGGVFPTRR